MAKQSVNTKAKPLGTLKKCRVVEVGIAGFAECLQQGPAPCSHAMPFGYCFLCMHPRVDDIIENTKRVQQAIKV